MASREEARAAKEKFLSTLQPDLPVYGVIGVGISGDKGKWSVSILVFDPRAKDNMPTNIDGVLATTTVVEKAKAL